MGEFLQSWLEIYFINAKAEQQSQYSTLLCRAANRIE